MRLGYAILYVRDVLASIEFYERAFGLKRKFVSEGALYGEMDTGATTLSFASLDMARSNFAGGVQPSDAAKPPQAFEVAFVTPDVRAAYEDALAAGARGLAPPKEKPWGQTVAYVRDPEGILVELASPM